MAATHVIATLILAFFMTSLPCDAMSMTKDLKIKYYGSAILRCHENDTIIPNSKVFWITPDAKVIDDMTLPTAFPKNVQLVNGTVHSMLNVTNVADDQFGYYTCVMVDDSSKEVSLTRWGLNVDGADFSELEKQYRDSAIIGAVAAAVMLVLVGGACIIWHYRYSKRAAASDRSSIEDDLKKPSPHMYANQGFESPAVVKAADIEMVETAEDRANGSTAVSGEDGGQNGGTETFRM